MWPPYYKHYNQQIKYILIGYYVYLIYKYKFSFELIKIEK